jgi:hypothetical protein
MTVQGWQAMGIGMLLIGLFIGIAIGVVIGRRSASPDAGELPPTSTVVPRVTPTTDGRPEVIAPNKRGQKVGLTEADFTPADDILVKMQQAWEQGEILDEEALPPPPPGPVATPEAKPPPSPEVELRLQRVLERLATTDDGQGGDVDDDTTPRQEGDASTVSEAIAELIADGYTDDLRLDDGHVYCGGCGTAHTTDMVEVDRVLRFEGPSDPADEAIVLGLRCPECGAQGILVSAFGPDADPALAEAFVYLASRARHR